MSNAQMLELDIFPVPITVINLGENSREMNKILMNELEEEMKDNYDAPLRTGVGVWQSNFGLEKRRETFANLAEMFLDLSIPTLTRAGFLGDLKSYMVCDDFWGNINDSPSAFNSPHIHGHGFTIFSGVYYPTSGILNGEEVSKKQDLDIMTTIRSATRPEPGDLVLMDPSYAVKNQVFPFKIQNNRYPYYGLEYCITPREGTLVLFPNYLMHYVAPTEKENFRRVSIAFSINLNE